MRLQIRGKARSLKNSRISIAPEQLQLTMNQTKSHLTHYKNDTSSLSRATPDSPLMPRTLAPQDIEDDTYICLVIHPPKKKEKKFVIVEINFISKS
jgi:hypothetical protein